MISQAKTQQKNKLYSKYLTSKTREPGKDCTELDRLFTLLDKSAKDPKVPNYYCGDVLTWIETELDKVFPYKV